MSAILFRTAGLASGTGRTVFGTVVPYGQVAEVSDGGRSYRERFEFGAFSRSISERGGKVKLFTGHDMRRLPVGRAVDLTEHRDGLHAAFEIAATRDGEDALELVRSGTVDSFSVGFRGVREHLDGDVVVRTEAALMEVSLVGLPAYAGASVGGVRSQLVIPRAVAAAHLSLMDW
ncbi:HK97 family phage prohead protease [Mycobacterium camsae]|uniref:HK97 family phage prohead protease n=1 Tax=Mycobacterium gordonae TaxID=1778 RepID=UPI00197F852E|nr:HK97 family phage prohead protease [Mycobacterium gordonae]